MTGDPIDLIEEEFKLKRLRRITDQTAADLRWRTNSDSEARELIDRSREQVLELFPEGRALFDLIYRPRFMRILRERAEQKTNS